MTSSPLFTSVAELVVTIRPMSQVGCASACAGVTSASDARRPAAERAAGGGEHQPADLAVACRRRGTGRSRSARCRPARLARRIAAADERPPMIRDSLFASASTAPVSSAAIVGPRPAAPVMPFTTTSASTSRTSASAASAPCASAGTPNRSACSSSSARLRPAARPTTSNRSGFAAITSSVCVPIEPVEPSSRTRRRLTRRSSVPWPQDGPTRIAYAGLACSSSSSPAGTAGTSPPASA